jgi:hypothetical protein
MRLSVVAQRPAKERLARPVRCRESGVAGIMGDFRRRKRLRSVSFIASLQLYSRVTAIIKDGLRDDG